MSGHDLRSLQRRIDECLTADRAALRRRLAGLRRKGRRAGARAVEAVAADIEASVERRRRRAESAPRPEYPPELPIVERREALAAAIRDHQVVVVAGETGSGKTTQLPKICLDLGLGAAGYIGLTQPRRIAARSIAGRIVEELGGAMGESAGYKVRFRDRVARDSYIKVMTDGILLAELQGDRFLDQYEVLIIDEAHERSLNIDFILGYLERLLPKRPDLKVVISSATIDTARFSEFFDDAPIVEVTGRMYPVEVRYRPLEEEGPNGEDRDQTQAILDAVDELSALDRGDILVFLSGEREIRETAEALRKHHPPNTDILPLYARQSAREQHRVFEPSGRRRIVLATNVAETSLTVPGIRYVIDPGYARISRYGRRGQVQRLPIEKISQASADQRAGRCGRVAAGVCVRLYSEADYQGRARFTDPEIRRTSLASAILQMQSLRLGDIERFPFLEPPDRKSINDGFRLLWELGALDERRELTELGRTLARLPVDPRIGRMLAAARDEGCLDEMLVLASALSVQDPRERPVEAQQAADERHRELQDPRSDFATLINIWRAFEERQRHLSQNKLRRWCRERFLSFNRMREWHDIHGQLAGLVKEMGWAVNREPAGGDAVHRALLAGLVTNVARKKEGHEYEGARGATLHIFPGSGLFRGSPKWIVAAELVETSRLFARTVARIDPAWVERVAPHLVKRHYREPHWEKRPARVAAYEDVTLYGLTVVTGRRVDFGRIEPARAREIFIGSALVDGEYETSAGFFEHNRALIADVEAIEDKARRRDVLVDPETLFRFYDERIPEDIHSGAAFERWRRDAEARDPRVLYLTREALMRHGAEEVTVERYPDRLTASGVELSLEYHFDPGHAMDGVTAVVPLAALNQLWPEPFEWLVPGLMEEKIEALIRTLPKSLRRSFVPAPDYARACREALGEPEGPLVRALGRELERMSGVSVPDEAWRPDTLPPHLIMNFRLVDGEGRTLATGRDLTALQEAHGRTAREEFRELPSKAIEREGVTGWDFGDLPPDTTLEQSGARIRGYPVLVDREGRVDLRVLDDPVTAARSHRAGLRRLFTLVLKDQRRFVMRQLPVDQRHALVYGSLDDPPPGVEVDPPGARDAGKALKEELVLAAFDQVLVGDDPDVRTQAEFERRLEAGRSQVVSAAESLGRTVAEVLERYQAIRARLRDAPSAWSHALTDIGEQLRHLVYRGFVLATPPGRLRHYPRYLRAVELRLERLEQAPTKDEERTRALRPYWRAYVEAAARGDGVGDGPLQDYRWMIEEYRVSLFAQQLKTAQPVSEKRLEEQWRRVAG